MNEDVHLRRELRFFRGYAVIMSLLAGVFLLGAAGRLRSQSFDTISAHRIDVTDENGDVRLALFGKEHEPPQILNGKSYHLRAGGDRDAGLMFYNDRRDEIGGLIYGSFPLTNGGIGQAQSLTFDAYKQDQELQLLHDQEGRNRRVGVIVNDAPSVSLTNMLPIYERIARLPEERRAAAYASLRRRGLASAPRVFAGVENRDATFVLRDAMGNARLRLSVSADGSPRIDFLNAAGRIVRTVS